MTLTVYTNTYFSGLMEAIHGIWQTAYWLETMRDGHKHLLIYLDFPPEAWGWIVLSFVFTVQRLVFVFNLKNSFVNILNNYRRTMKINNDA